MYRPDVKLLSELFEYHQTGYGALIWKSGRLRGELAGTIMGNPPELRVRVNGKSLLAAKIVWALTMGHWPENRLKFEDGDRTHINIDNLIETDRVEGPGR